MYILAIETTGAFASVAITDGQKILSSVQGNDRFSHLQNLMPQVQQVLEEGGLQIGDVTAIATSVGPGSFTGIRIGVSSTRALAQILRVPCVPVSSLQALALRAADEAGSALICPMLDARRSQVYAGGYVIEDGHAVEKVKAAPYTLAEFMEAISEYESVILLGDGADAYEEKAREIRNDGLTIADESIRYQHADTVALLGAKLHQQMPGGGIDYEDLQPDYMRIPEAERKLKEQQAKSENDKDK